MSQQSYIEGSFCSERAEMSAILSVHGKNVHSKPTVTGTHDTTELQTTESVINKMKCITVSFESNDKAETFVMPYTENVNDSDHHRSITVM